MEKLLLVWTDLIGGLILWDFEVNPESFVRVLDFPGKLKSFQVLCAPHSQTKDFYLFIYLFIYLSFLEQAKIESWGLDYNMINMFKNERRKEQ